MTHDLYDIADRLKEIDKDYFVFFSYRDRRYEVHNRAQRGGTLALTVPYPRLDERTVRLVRRSRAERADEFIAETERENAKLEATLLSKAADKAARDVEKAFSAL